MKIEEVPQDKGNYRGREQNRKIMYATDKDGSYKTVNSDGWEVEHMATQQAWEQASLELEETLDQIKAHKLSPIAYFMKKHLMDTNLLAKHVGKWQWQVKQHLKHSVFLKLSESTLQKYATAFNTSVDAIKNFDPEKAQKH